MAEEEGAIVDNDQNWRCKNCKWFKPHNSYFQATNRIPKYSGVCKHQLNNSGPIVKIDGRGCFNSKRTKRDNGRTVVHVGPKHGCIHCESDEKAEVVGVKLSDDALKRQDRWFNVAQKYLNDEYREEEILKSKWLADAILARYEFDSVLEIGCGCGRNLYIIGQKYPTVRRSGCDICDRAIKIARNKVLGADFVVASLYNLGKDARGQPYFNRQFDLTLLVSVLMFVPTQDLQIAVAEVKRVTKRYIVEVEWCREGVANKELTWNRDYTHVYEPEFKCIDIKSLSRAYVDKDLPLMLWCFERQEG